MKNVIQAFINTHSLIQKGDTVIVGLSGGPDSVFLLHMLHLLQAEHMFTLRAAHLNHGWRSDADNDELFCKNLCASLNIPFSSTRADTLSCTQVATKGLEEQGRMLRRFYFSQLVKEHNATSVALGHHKDDQIETFFIRLIRGASLEGLGCIRPKKDGYIRPLLTVTKQEILTYLKINSLDYMFDSTNNSDLFLRNRLRTLIPLFQNADRRFEDNTFKTIMYLQTMHDEWNNILKEKYSILVHDKKILDTRILLSYTPMIQKGLVVQWLLDNRFICTLSDTLIEEIIRFLISPRGGTHTIHTSTIIKKNNKAFIRSL